tara:strand:- start:440 stop:1054 length:615 start_codon:yes stop_codon:yes gene_type:complete
MTSKLIVNSVRHTGASADAITMDASGNVTFPGNATCSGTPSGFGGITEADQFLLTSNLSVSGTATTVTSNLARSGYSFMGTNSKIGTGMSESGGVFTFPSTGKYLITTCATFQSTNQAIYAAFRSQLSVDGGSNWYYIMVNYTSIFDSGSDTVYAQANGQALVDITDVSTHKFRCSATSNSSITVVGHVNEAFTSIMFTRLGDT